MECSISATDACTPAPPPRPHTHTHTHAHTHTHTLSRRLASGDSEGGVVVWDVLTQTPVARLEEAGMVGGGPLAVRGVAVRACACVCVGGVHGWGG